MKVYKITSYFDLIEKPEWLDSFRKKYDSTCKYHSSYKFQTSVEDNSVEKIRNILKETTSKYPASIVVFNEYSFNKTAKGNIIMVSSKGDNAIYEYQKELISNLKGVGKPLRDEYKKYEDNFLLHITIARRLSDGTFEKAKAELREPINCKAKIGNVTLTVVDNWSPEETDNPKNRSVFYFSN